MVQSHKGRTEVFFPYFYISPNGINEKLSAHNNREDDCDQNAQSIQKCIKKLNIKFAISGHNVHPLRSINVELSLSGIIAVVCKKN